MKKNILFSALLTTLLFLSKQNSGQNTYMTAKTDIVPGIELSSPKILLQPISQTQCVGSSVSFYVQVSGSSLTFQWRKGIKNLVNDDFTSGATSPVLTLSNLKHSNESNDYNVLINGSTSPNVVSQCASLIVSASPIISSQPISQTVCPGSHVFFPVTANGIGLKYQWRKGNKLLVNGGNISGANTSELNLKNVSVKDNGANYNVVISSLCSPLIISANMSLFILSLPIIVSQPTSQNSCSNDSVHFSVSAVGSGLNYQWRKGSENLNNIGSISGIHTAKLTITSANESDAAKNYNVVISGPCASKLTSNFVSLEVVYKTLIVGQPVSQSGTEGSSIVFDVLATGSDISYQWRNGKTHIINGNLITGANSAVLIIHSSLLSDFDTDYNVIVGGKCSEDQSSLHVSLINEHPAKIAMKPIEQ